MCSISVFEKIQLDLQYNNKDFDIEKVGTIWRPIRYDDSDNSCSDLIKLVLEPLAKAKIVVFTLSINSYPIILVQESDLEYSILQLRCFCRIYDENEIYERLSVYILYI